MLKSIIYFLINIFCNYVILFLFKKKHLMSNLCDCDIPTKILKWHPWCVSISVGLCTCNAKKNQASKGYQKLELLTMHIVVLFSLMILNF